MKQQLKRQTLASSTWTAFEFDIPCRSFFVKNFTEGDIYVSFAQEENTSTSFKIPSMFAEEVYISNKDEVNTNWIKNIIYVYSSSGGEVEVEELDIR